MAQKRSPKSSRPSNAARRAARPQKKSMAERTAEREARKAERQAAHRERRQPRHDPLVGTEATVAIERIAHGGVSVGHLEDGRVVFVTDTLPGETVRVRITEAKKKFAKAIAVAVDDPAPERVDHVWAEASIDRDPAERAGGAEFGHIALAEQRELKATVLHDALTRMGGVDDEVAAQLSVAPIGFDDETNGLGWRTRVRLHVDPDTGRVGPYAAGSNTVVPVESLPLADERLDPLAPLDAVMPDVESVQLLAPSMSEPRMLLQYRGEKSPVGTDESVIEAAGDWNFLVRAGGFWQVHHAAADTLIQAVSGATEMLGDRVDPTANNLDLYGGVGLLAAGFLDAAGDRARITTVEAAESATDLAAENLGEFAGVQALTSTVESYVKDLLQSSQTVRERLARGTVIVDPPRKGAGTEVTQGLVELAPQNVIYVACDPVALARDTRVLREGGYELVSAQGFDLFPHTHHFETVAVFTR